MAAGTSVPIRDTDLVVRFDGVTSDSRCPSDVQCVSAGDALVQLTVTSGRATPSHFELHTDGMREIVSGRYRLTLVDLKPLPVSTQPVNPGDYVLTLRVSGS